MNDANKTCLVVMQPTFLPWAGYFNLIANADHFVFLDDVQLEKQSWQTRNRLIFNGQIHWVSVPVRHEHLGQSIAETLVVINQRWRDKLLRSFSQNYGNHPCACEAKEIINFVVAQQVDSLATLNELTIQFIAERLGISANFHRASNLNIKAARSERLIAICRHFDAQKYLSTPGSKNYLLEDGFGERCSVNLVFQEYIPLPYEQKGTSIFESHLSVVDVVANLGWEKTLKYILKGSL